MLVTNLKVVSVVVGTILFYTFLANSIPQVESEVPQELTLGANFTVAEIVAAGEELYFGAGGCTTCHGTGTRAPDLIAGGSSGLALIGARCGDRVPGIACKDYLHQSLVEPNAHVVEGFQPIMPNMGRTLSEAQIWALVAYMENQGGEVSVDADDLAGAMQAAGATTMEVPGSGAGTGPTAASTTMDPVALLEENQCMLCHQLGDQGGPIGPPFTDIGRRRDAAAIRHAILEPNAEITPGFEAVGGTMPTTFGQQMTAAQLEAIVQFLAAQR